MLASDEAIPAGTLDMFLELVRAQYGAQLLRVKGIVKLAEMPDTPVVVHGVQHIFHPTARLERWPDDDHRSRLVFITRDLPERRLRELFEAFIGAANVDRPDRAALTDNPLVPFGGVDGKERAVLDCQRTRRDITPRRRTLEVLQVRRQIIPFS